MFDANGNWIPDEDPNELWNATPPSWGPPPAQQQAPPVPPSDPSPEIPEAQAAMPQAMPQMPSSPSMPEGPSPAQLSLEDNLGIRTRGPKADAAATAARAYRPESYGKGTSLGERMMPQQFGEDGEVLDEERPMSPAGAADKFMAENPDAKRGNLGLNIRQHSLGSGDRQAANQAYEQRVQADRTRRAEERETARSRPSAVAARERQSADVSRVQQMMDGPSSPGAPSVTRAGGAMFVGPGFGRRENDYGGRYNGANRNFDPQLEQKHEQRNLDRGLRKELAGTQAGLKQQGLDQSGQRITNQKTQFDTGMLFKKGESAIEQRKELDELVAEFRRRSDDFQADGDPDIGRSRQDSTGKEIPGQRYQGSYNAIQRRILEVVGSLNNLHEDGAYDFQVDPDMDRWIRNIRAARGADGMKRPTP